MTRLKSGQIGVDWPVKRRYPGLEAGPISDWPDNGSKFSIANGSVVNGPAVSALAAVSIKVQGTSIVQA